MCQMQCGDFTAWQKHHDGAQLLRCPRIGMLSPPRRAVPPVLPNSSSRAELSVQFVGNVTCPMEIIPQEFRREPELGVG